MRFGSLFSGIGGWDLGLERAGMSVAWQCDIDPWCRRVDRIRGLGNALVPQIAEHIGKRIMGHESV